MGNKYNTKLEKGLDSFVHCYHSLYRINYIPVHNVKYHFSTSKVNKTICFSVSLSVVYGSVSFSKQYS